MSATRAALGRSSSLLRVDPHKSRLVKALVIVAPKVDDQHACHIAFCFCATTVLTHHEVSGIATGSATAVKGSHVLCGVGTSDTLARSK